MIDLKYYQNNYDHLGEALQYKGFPDKNIEPVFILLDKLKEKRQRVENMLAEKNALSKEFGVRKSKGEDTSDISEKSDLIKRALEIAKVELEGVEVEVQSLVLTLPNPPLDCVPVGLDEDDNEEIRRVLSPKDFDFTPKNHWDLAEINDWVDFKRGVKLAKTRFSVLKGQAAKLERALINFFLDENEKKGFTEYAVPFLNNRDMLQDTGQLPKFEEDLFKVEGENLYLIPTAEVPLTNMFNDEILQKKDLPLLMTGYTPCFRKEAGSAGADTRGMIRQHQFSKVEMVALTTPEQSEEVFEMMVQHASDLLTKLGLPHRLMELCTRDLGFSAARTIDLEVWLPGAGVYREISSVSNMTDFQARRAKIRYKEDKSNKLVNTLNGSALAVGRTIVAIMENYQREDGTIEIPEILRGYMGE